jgi:hypothetical protein
MQKTGQKIWQAIVKIVKNKQSHKNQKARKKNKPITTNLLQRFLSFFLNQIGLHTGG